MGEGSNHGRRGEASNAPWEKQTGKCCTCKTIKANEQKNEAKKKGADGQDQRQLEIEERLESHQGADSKGAQMRREG